MLDQELPPAYRALLLEHFPDLAEVDLDAGLAAVNLAALPSGDDRAEAVVTVLTEADAAAANAAGPSSGPFVFAPAGTGLRIALPDGTLVLSENASAAAGGRQETVMLEVPLSFEAADAVVADAVDAAGLAAQRRTPADGMATYFVMLDAGQFVAGVQAEGGTTVMTLKVQLFEQ